MCVDNVVHVFVSCQELKVTTGPVVLSFRLGCLCPCSTPSCTCAVTETLTAFVGRCEGYAFSSHSQYADMYLLMSGLSTLSQPLNGIKAFRVSCAKQMNDASCRNAINGVTNKLYVLAGVHRPFQVKVITGKGVGKVHDDVKHRLKTLKKKKTLVRDYTDGDAAFLIDLLGPTQGACRYFFIMFAALNSPLQPLAGCAKFSSPE